MKKFAKIALEKANEKMAQYQNVAWMTLAALTLAILNTNGAFAQITYSNVVGSLIPANLTMDNISSNIAAFMGIPIVAFSLFLRWGTSYGILMVRRLRSL